MNKYLSIFFILFCSCHISRHRMLHSSPLIENAILIDKEIKIAVATSGDAYDDPNECYIVSIIKKDSIYISTCCYRGNTIIKTLNKNQLLMLSNFEKKIIKERNRKGLCDVYVRVSVDGHYNNFNIDCGEDNDFDAFKKDN